MPSPTTAPRRGYFVMGADDAEQGEKTDELMAAVGRLMRRG